MSSNWTRFLLFLIAKALTIDAETSTVAHRISSNGISCPPWSESSGNGVCECSTNSDILNKIIWCSNNILSLPNCYCLSYNRDFNKTVFGFCTFRCFVPVHDAERENYTGTFRYQVVIKNYNLNELNDNTCSSLQMNRTGQMCGRCVEGFAPPVYSYSLTCVKCSSNYKYNWMKYIAVAYLPLTVFFIIVITFRISAASGAMNGFILTSQIIMSPAAWTYVYFGFTYKVSVWFKVFTTFYGTWNLDFLRLVYTPFCLHSNLSILQTRALDYVVAVYPLLLVLVAYIIASLHYRYLIVVRIWSPFYRCFRLLRREWDIKNSLIKAFATFILLSYVKILNISLDLLTPLSLYDLKEKPLDKYYLNMDGTTEYFGKEHYPLAILALVMTFFFNFLPLMLLCLFPCRLFHKCLNFFQIQRETLREFVFAFQGELKDQPHDCRYFAAYFLFLRIINLLSTMFFVEGVIYSLFCVLLFAISSVLIALFKPYRRSLHNYIEILMMLLCAFFFLAQPARKLVKAMVKIKHFKVYHTLWIIIISVHPVYGLFFFIYTFLPMQKIKLCTLLLVTKIKETVGKCSSLEPEDRLPYRLEHMDEYPPLLPPVN